MKSYRVNVSISGWATRKIANDVRDHLLSAINRDLPNGILVHGYVGEDIMEDDPPQQEKGKRNEPVKRR